MTSKPDRHNKLASVKKNTARPKWGASEQHFVFEIDNAETAVLLTRWYVFFTGAKVAALLDLLAQKYEIGRLGAAVCV